MMSTAGWNLTGNHRLAAEGDRVVLMVEVRAPYPSVGSGACAKQWRPATPNDLLALVKVNLSTPVIAA